MKLFDYFFMFFLNLLLNVALLALAIWIVNENVLAPLFPDSVQTLTYWQASALALLVNLLRSNSIIYLVRTE